MLLFIAIVAAFGLSGCAVYTVEKTQLEHRLKPTTVATHHGLGLNKLMAMYKQQYNNKVDTLVCVDRTGNTTLKRLNCDSKITVITHDKRSLNFYAKTLYIWNNEFLIGERTTIHLRGPNCATVRLSDIARIEVRG